MIRNYDYLGHSTNSTNDMTPELTPGWNALIYGYHWYRLSLSQIHGCRWV